MKIKGSQGFTLVEIMIVVAIIAIVSSVGFSNYLGIRDKAKKATCVSNLKKLDDAKAMWMLENGGSSGINIEMAELVTAYLRAEPVCPAGGTYEIGDIENQPVCSIAEHRLNNDIS